VFNVVDDEPLLKREYADASASTCGYACRAAALLFGDRLTSLTRSLRFTNTRFRTGEGWAPRYPKRPRAVDGDGAAALRQGQPSFR
jgi:hypothetical protein